MSSNETYDTDIVDISEFFSSGDSGTSATDDESNQQSTFSEVDSPIKELKIIILSLDWEITDEIADSFITEVDRLAEVWNNDKVVVSFLKILRAVGKYLRTHKADAHPDSVNLLYSVYNNFEKIVLTDEISTDQEKAILNEELKKFAKLKEKIAAAASAASAGTANESLLSALKSILLEIDWNITDQTMQKFDIEINKLEKVWSTDKDYLTPLQMMRAIGSYINKNKLDSHPDSIKLLSSIFKNFEKMALTDEMPEEEKQEIIQADLQRFTELKEQILSVKNEKPAKDNTVEEPLPPATKTAEMPGQIHDDQDGPETDDIGFVAPISDDTSESDLQSQESPVMEPQGDKTVEEVGGRLDDLFGQSDSDTPLDELPGDKTTPADDDGLVPLPGIESSEETDAPTDINEVSPLPDSEDEIVPLPGVLESDQTDVPAAMDDVAPLPDGEGDIVTLPGVDPTEQTDDQATTDDVIPLQTDSEESAPGEVTRLGDENLQNVAADKDHDTPDIDNHIDDFFGSEKDSEQLPETPPITEEQASEKTSPASSDSKSDNLLSIIDSIDFSDESNDFSALSGELKVLKQAFSGTPMMMFLQLINSLVVYHKLLGTAAHKECTTILRSCAKSLSESEKLGDTQINESLIIFQSELDKFTSFQETIVFPTLSGMVSKEKEIKKILGLVE